MARIKRLILLTLLVLSLNIQPASAVPLDIGVIYNPDGTGAILYSDKSTDSGQLGFYYNGTDASIYQYDGKWVYVRMGSLKNPLEGYLLEGSYIISYKLDDPPSFQHKSQYASLSGKDSCLLMSMPDPESPVMEEYPSGTLVLVLGEANGWWYVRIHEEFGFVRSDEITYDVQTTYNEEGFPIKPTAGQVWLDTEHEEIPMYSPSIYNEPFMQSMDEILQYSTDRLNLLADLGEWYYVEFIGYPCFVESIYFVKNEPTTIIMSAP